MSKKVMIILWLLPAFNVSLYYIMGYLIIPLAIPDIDGGHIGSYILGGLFLLLYFGLPLLMPLSLLQKKKSVGIKEAILSISSVIIANLIFIAPELIYVIQVKDFDFFDEDTVYRTMVSITMATSFICSGITFYISHPKGKKDK